MNTEDLIPELQARLQEAKALHRAGRLAEARGCFEALQGRLPDSSRLLTALGTICLQMGDLKNSVNFLDRSLGREPNQIEALANLGIALRRLGRSDEALASYERAIALRPDLVVLHLNRATVLRDLKRFDEALAGLDRAIALAPNYADGYLNRGNVLRDLNELEESLASYRRAIALKPDQPVMYLNQGNALRDLNRLEEALASFERALALKPDYAEAHLNRGIALRDLKRLDEALESFDRTLSLSPNEAEGNWNKALLKLLWGDFEQGWQLYEVRWQREHGSASRYTARKLPQPKWLGEQDIRDKTLLIYAEQGLGDTIQFCRYVSLAVEAGAKVVLEAQEPLIPLLSAFPGDVRIVAQGAPLPPYDLHCPMMSLPLACKTTLSTVPASVPYLSADAEKNRDWRRRLGEKTRPRVGLAWSGSSLHKDDRNRSIPFRLLAPLLDLPVEFHALQKEIRPEDEAALRASGKVILHQDQLDDFSDTAALAEEMDLVISVDTSVAHLVGALGRKLWLLLPYTPDFRWLLDRSDSPWYPTMVLFRQSTNGGWPAVISAVAERLRQGYCTDAGLEGPA